MAGGLWPGYRLAGYRLSGLLSNGQASRGVQCFVEVAGDIPDFYGVSPDQDGFQYVGTTTRSKRYPSLAAPLPWWPGSALAMVAWQRPSLGGLAAP